MKSAKRGDEGREQQFYVVFFFFFFLVKETWFRLKTGELIYKQPVWWIRTQAASFCHACSRGDDCQLNDDTTCSGILGLHQRLGKRVP